MSYEHCDKHNRDATNGCDECGEERRAADDVMTDAELEALRADLAAGFDPMSFDLGMGLFYRDCCAKLIARLDEGGGEMAAAISVVASDDNGGLSYRCDGCGLHRSSGARAQLPRGRCPSCSSAFVVRSRPLRCLDTNGTVT